jgi:uncharacterized membrane protein YhaH (DUF805 family)
MVGFGEAIKRAFAGWATWSGRATRAEYWWWALFVFLVSVIPDVGVFASMDWSQTSDGTYEGSGTGASLLWVLLAVMVWVAILLPSIAVSVRRLHDTSRSGWWYWIVLIPCGIGAIWYFVLMVLPSSQGQNQYG